MSWDIIYLGHLEGINTGWGGLVVVKLEKIELDYMVMIYLLH